MTKKACTKCKKIKELELFLKDKRHGDGRTSACKECTYLSINEKYKNKLRPAAKLRKNRDYYLIELEKNAKRNIQKKYSVINPNRLKQTRAWTKAAQKITGAGRQRKKWSGEEIKYLAENYLNVPVVEMALKLERSFSSVSHKLCRLGFIYYNKWNH